MPGTFLSLLDEGSSQGFVDQMGQMMNTIASNGVNQQSSAGLSRYGITADHTFKSKGRNQLNPGMSEAAFERISSNLEDMIEGVRDSFRLKRMYRLDDFETS